MVFSAAVSSHMFPAPCVAATMPAGRQPWRLKMANLFEIDEEVAAKEKDRILAPL